MAADERVTQLEEFLAERGRPLLRAAALLGGGPEAGEDLLQAALERQRMEQATAQIQVPHGLAERAARHRRWRGSWWRPSRRPRSS